MTPFGIRSKLRDFFGRPVTGERPDETVPLTFILPNGTEFPTRSELRYTLVMASQLLETPIATGCPDGHCGGCVVDILDSTGLAPPTAAETKLLEPKGEPNTRMACHARVAGPGAKVKIRQVWSLEALKGD